MDIKHIIIGDLINFTSDIRHVGYGNFYQLVKDINGATCQFDLTRPLI